MPDTQQAVIRADASSQIGSGHVTRCLALAETLVIDGWQVAFAGTRETRQTVKALAASQYRWIELNAANDTVTLQGNLAGCDLLVVDHYGLDATYETACRPWAKQILAIDDLADRRHDCDFLLDQTAGRRPGDYAALVPANCQIRTGSAYALLRSQFAQHRQQSAAAGETVRRVLLSFGATDPAQVTLPALNAVQAALPAAAIDVAIGSAAPHLPAIRAASAELGATLHVDVKDMAQLMGQADLAIAAAGTVVWELCAMERPMLLLQTAANQTGVIGAMTAHGAAMAVQSITDLSPAVATLAGDAARRHSLAAAAASLCDGRGAARIAQTIRPEIARDGLPVTLRPVTLQDAKLLLDWQRMPETRRYARNPAIPELEEHMAWLRRRLADPACLFNLVLHKNEPAGMVRLDRRTAGLPATFEVSIFVAPGKYRLGLGHAALELLQRLVPEAVLDAEVHPDNAASHALFRKAGYIPLGNNYRLNPRIAVSGSPAS